MASAASSILLRDLWELRALRDKWNPSTRTNLSAMPQIGRRLPPRPPHQHKPRLRQMPDQPVGGNSRHRLIRVIDSLPPLIAQRERQALHDLLHRSLPQRDHSPLPSKEPVQEPAHIAADPILPIPAPEQPVTMAVLIFHLEVIAPRPGFPAAFPPLSGDPFRPIGAAHPMPHPPPGERHR